MLSSLILASVLAQGASGAAQPARPADGTYTYALRTPAGALIFTSTVVVTGHGPTFVVAETAKLPNGAVATTATTWSSATLLPLRYDLHQGTISVQGTIAPGSVEFTATNGTKTLTPLSYTLMPGTKFMLVYEGLNAFRMMLPYVIWAHPGEALTVAHINGVQREQAEASAAAPLTGGPSGDRVSVIALGDEQLTAWRNPTTGAIDEENVSPGNTPMVLLHYGP